MFAVITHKGKTYKTDLSKPIDISIPMRAEENGVRAWYVDPIKIEPVRAGDWVGEVKQGGSVNFRNIFFNPHGHGTHTECVGHISEEDYSINKELREFFFIAELITVLPHELENGDKVITRKMLQVGLGDKRPEAVVIRTIHNGPEKLARNYSNTNPPYVEADALSFLVSHGVDHLLLDLPSVDREIDEGKLLAHRAFWEYPDHTKSNRTITEMVYIANDVYDGTYLLNLQFVPFENDASPSRPVLFRIVNE